MSCGMAMVLLEQTSPDIASEGPQKTFAEFFAGIGLMRMGLERQGWSLAFANDIEPPALPTNN